MLVSHNISGIKTYLWEYILKNEGNSQPVFTMKWYEWSPPGPICRMFAIAVYFNAWSNPPIWFKLDEWPQRLQTGFINIWNALSKKIYSKVFMMGFSVSVGFMKHFAKIHTTASRRLPSAASDRRRYHCQTGRDSSSNSRGWNPESGNWKASPASPSTCKLF